MKKIALLLCLLFTWVGWAQDSITINTFTELKVFDRIKVRLFKSTEDKMIVSGTNKDKFVFEDANGLLKLRMKLDAFLSGRAVSVDLYYTNPLVLIDVNENAFLESGEIMKGSKISLRAQDAAVITLQLDMDTVTLKSTTRSEIRLSGKTNTQEITINTGGKVLNKECTTKKTTVIVLAGGYADVFATDSVIAKVKAGGTINVYGKPKILDRDDTFGGKIHMITE